MLQFLLGCGLLSSYADLAGEFQQEDHLHDRAGCGDSVREGFEQEEHDIRLWTYAAKICRHFELLPGTYHGQKLNSHIMALPRLMVAASILLSPIILTQNTVGMIEFQEQPARMTERQIRSAICRWGFHQPIRLQQSLLLM